jgi:penicillin-binding protein 1A
MMSWNPRVAMGIWVGNHVPKAMKSALSSLVGPTVDDIMKPIHQDIFAKDGTWKSGDWFTMPAGVQRISVNGRTDLFPSWYNKNAPNAGTMMTFDKVSKKKATDCTPDSAKDEQSVTKITDPITKKTSYIAPFGYDATADDDLHRCDDVQANILGVTSSSSKKNTYTISAQIGASTHAIDKVELIVNGSVVGTLTGSGSNSTYTITTEIEKGSSATVRVTDVALYTDSSPVTFN